MCIIKLTERDLEAKEHTLRFYVENSGTKISSASIKISVTTGDSGEFRGVPEVC